MRWDETGMTVPTIYTTPQFVITDEMVQMAFDELAELATTGPAAKAMREQREDEADAAKARAFLMAEGPVAERTERSKLDNGYLKARQRFYEALQADEECRARRSRAEAIIEAWRTCQSNERAFARLR